MDQKNIHEGMNEWGGGGEGKKEKWGMGAVRCGSFVCGT